jgi:predicted KAP-like P-loop ATPase
LTLPQVNEEINYLDFASLEAIRIFCPDVYNELPNNKDTLLGNALFFSLNLNKEDIEKRKKRIEEIVKLEGKNRQQKILTSIISELFPHAGEADYHGYNQNYRKYKRICSSIRFDRYFLLDVPTGEISQIEIDNALKILSNKDDFICLLKEYKDKNILDQFLERMKDYINEISHENIKNIIEVFFDVGDVFSPVQN